MRRSSLLAVLCSGTMAATLVAAAPAQARPGHHQDGLRPVAEGLAGPLSLAVHDGSPSLTVAQSFGVDVTRLDKRGTATTLATYQGVPGAGEVTGVSLGPHGTYYINTDFAAHASHVDRVDGSGRVTTVSANLMAYEDAHNPDGAVSYGLQGLDEECTSTVQEFQDGLGTGPEAPHLVGYTGILDSHPYQTSVSGQGDVYVADAAANAILRVAGRTGEISTVAVIPAPAPVTITEEIVDAMFDPEHAPDAATTACMVDHAFVAEPVPTDVEIGRDGMLYVSTLGGGLGELLPLGAVYRVDPADGAVTWLAGGMRGATGLDLLGRDVVVAEMFGGRVSVVRPGSATADMLFEVPTGPADVEVHANRVYVSTLAGEVLRARLG